MFIDAIENKKSGNNENTTKPKTLDFIGHWNYFLQ